MDMENVVGDVRSAQAVLLSELDARKVPQGDGARSINEWAKGRLDVSDDTTSDLVRLARNLHHDPGEGSVDRRVATVKLAEAGASEQELERSGGFDIAGVRRFAAQLRRFTRTDHEEAFKSRYLCLQPSLDEGTWRIHGQLVGADGKIVEDALTERGDSLPPDPDGMFGSISARKADALVSICQDAGDVDSDNSSSGGATIFVDANQAAPTNGEAGVTIESGPRVGVDAIEEILCDGTLEVIVRAEDGTPMKYGRKTRVVPPKLRKAVMHRDGHACTIDGCSSSYRLQVHHIIPYLEWGRTDPENLTTVCWYHHHVAIHGAGMRFDPESPPQRRRLLRSNHPRPPP